MNALSKPASAEQAATSRDNCLPITMFEERPKPLEVRQDGIPFAMRAVRAWMNWRYVERGERWTKVPYQTNGRPASSTDPATWTDFNTVLAAYRTGRFDGVGIALGGDMGGGSVLACIDFDHVDDTPERKQRAEAILAEFSGAYAEWSPSGGGLHVFFLTQPLARAIVRGGVEIYTGGRYITVTGHVLEGSTWA